MRRYLLIACLAALSCAPVLALAQASNNFVALAPAQGQLGELTSQTTLSGYLNTLFKVALSVGAMLAVLRLVWGGYIYMVSGVGNWASQGRAREIIGNAILGIVLLLAIYLILNQINPCILNLDITSSFSGGSSCSGG